MNARRDGGSNGVLKPPALSAPIRAAFVQLLEAHQLARASGHDDLDFAAEITNLTELGITPSVLRWLVCRGYAKCLREVTQPTDKQRHFEPVDNLALGPQSCFVLSRKGMLLAHSISELQGIEPDDDGDPDDSDSSDHAQPANGSVLLWDAKRRELRMNQKLVKRFRVPAPNQEAVLAAFQEEGWPNCIDDPLPPKGDQDPKRRLHDTIKALNRKHCQRPSMIRFLGNGTGENIVWELRVVARPAPTRRGKARHSSASS